MSISPSNKHVHLVTLVAFPEKEISGRELQRVSILTKKVRRIHECNGIGDRDYKEVTIPAKLRLCDNHFRAPSARINAERTATKAALQTCRNFLARSHHGVGVTQAVGQYFHHMRRKMRRLLNEKVEPAPVDLRQAGGFLGHSIGCPETVTDQRHLAK